MLNAMSNKLYDGMAKEISQQPTANSLSSEQMAEEIVLALRSMGNSGYIMTRLSSRSFTKCTSKVTQRRDQGPAQKEGTKRA